MFAWRLVSGPSLAVAVVFATGCGGGGEEVAHEAAATASPAPPVESAPEARQMPFRTNTPFLTPLPVGYRLESVLEGLEFPTALAATPDGRLLVTEQTTGRVRVVQGDVLEDEPWFELPVYFAEDVFLQELGLVGIAVDPRFEDNRFVYIYYSEQDEKGIRRTVLARLRDADGKGTDLTKLLAVDFAPEQTHIGGGIVFDGDNAILLGVGDHELPWMSARLDSLPGKVLRIDRDGNALPDNPFVGREDADPRIYAYGLRNPFGVAVDQSTGRKFVTENRDTTGDALYELEPGANYGWPDHVVVLREPLIIYEEPMGMAAVTVYRGEALSEFQGDLFYCTHHAGGGLHWSEVGELEGFDLVRRDRLIAPGCTSGVTVGADGFLYFLSYGDGKLLRISG